MIYYRLWIQWRLKLIKLLLKYAKILNNLFKGTHKN
jgi:hypothetical protein